MPLLKFPDIEKCCLCVTDLKAATAIIAVLGIVTSPAVSWAVVRHSYVIRVSCFVTTANTRPDIVDVNLNNILSFGFGANAGLGPSCLGPMTEDKTEKPTLRKTDPATSSFVGTVKYIGWVVLVADIIFLITSIIFLIKIFKGDDKRVARVFIITAIISILLSFIYAMLYVTACVSIGGAFPIFEFIFALIDVIIWTMWIYFILVTYAYLNFSTEARPEPTNETQTICPLPNLIWNAYEYLTNVASQLLRLKS